jgi:hypothetical protein
VTDARRTVRLRLVLVRLWIARLLVWLAKTLGCDERRAEPPALEGCRNYSPASFLKLGVFGRPFPSVDCD